MEIIYVKLDEEFPVAIRIPASSLLSEVIKEELTLSAHGPNSGDPVSIGRVEVANAGACNPHFEPARQGLGHCSKSITLADFDTTATTF